MHQVSASELDDLVSGRTSLYWVLCGIFFGSCISLAGVSISISVVNARIHATFLTLCILSAMLSSVFYGLAAEAHRKAKRKVKQVKETEAEPIHRGTAPEAPIVPPPSQRSAS
jgi:hypothetical protein